MYASERSTTNLRHAHHVRLVHGEAVAAHPEGRLCAHPQCQTVLSRYNPSSTCCRHDGWKDDRIRHHH